MQKTLRLIILLISAGLLLSGALMAGEEAKARVFWSEYYSLLRATPDRLQEIKEYLKIPDREISVVRYNKDQHNYYLISGSRGDDIESYGGLLEKSPPFKLIDQELPYRKKARALENWMRGYKDYELIKRVLFSLEKRFPDYAKVYVIGKTTHKRPIYALKISDNPTREENEPSFLFNSAHHGNEILSIEYSTDLAYYLLHGRSAYEKEATAITNLRDEYWRKQTNRVGTVHFRSSQLQSYLDQYEIWIVPVVNPDGLHSFWHENSWSGRKNGRKTTNHSGWHLSDGVDLNRNYPFRWNSGQPRASSPHGSSLFYRGPSAGSEPETRAMMKLAERQRFVASFSFHCYATKILTPYTIEGTISPTPNPSWILAERLRYTMDSHRADKDYVAVRNLYPIDGTDQDWLFHEYGTLAFIMEGSYHSPRYEPEGRLSVQGMRPAALHLLEAFQEGPRLLIRTTDQRGRPLGSIPFRIEEFVYYENEQYTTHPVLGRYDYLLDRPGRFTVLIEDKRFQPIRKQVECNSSICPIQLKLTPAKKSSH